MGNRSNVRSRTKKENSAVHWCKRASKIEAGHYMRETQDRPCLKVSSEVALATAIGRPFQS